MKHYYVVHAFLDIGTNIPTQFLGQPFLKHRGKAAASLPSVFSLPIPWHLLGLEEPVWRASTKPPFQILALRTVYFSKQHRCTINASI